MASDAMLDGTGKLEALDGIVGQRHAFSPWTRFNIHYPASRQDHDITLTGTAATEAVD
jgi:hypothetical protein